MKICSRILILAAVLIAGTRAWPSSPPAAPLGSSKFTPLMDNQGLTIVLQPGRQYKEAAQNVLEETKDGKSQEQMVSTPVFEGSRMYYRTPNYLYCIGQ